MTFNLTTAMVHSPVSSWNIQVSLSRGDSSYPWVSVHALNHNLGKGRTLYCTLFSRYIVNSLLGGMEFDNHDYWQNT